MLADIKYTFGSLTPVQMTTLLAALELSARQCAVSGAHLAVSRGDAFKQLHDYIYATLKEAPP